VSSAQKIDRDLVRWRRGKWIAVIATIFALQLGMFIWASQKQAGARAVYPAEPKVAFAPAPGALDHEWLEMENPFLFASASRKGFSGEAWLRQPKWTVPEPRQRTEPAFLQLRYAREFNPTPDAARSFEAIQRHRTTTVFPPPDIPPSSRTQASELRLGGFQGRALAVPVPLPAQYHSDVLSSSVVEAMIDRDGLVISARVIENSGSAKADSDALALTRRARFTPLKSDENVPEVGKLIFEWFALELGHTNNVKR
jgi:TonB family protein